MKAFRAYFDFYDVPTEVEENAAAARVSMNFQDETSGMSTAIMDKQARNSGDLFDLQGRKVKTPKKGLYIRNGRKELVK